ncbi:HAMP domain-containing sensor histidine kinase [Nocardioides sp. W7]|uniref:sensor histidine kinase n=1 Tax=Nocardioides sp. W7 TaxID=2931390 RepID=UPI001FD4FEFA|nr:HAMP domain-containing sensor histidine kinase [Nocardioides sp. W7]
MMSSPSFPNGLQPVRGLASASPAAVTVAVELLTSRTDIAAAVEAVVGLLSSYPEIDGVTVAIIGMTPERTEGWVPLGSRAWLREWTAPGATCSVAPPEGAGPEQAFSLTWLSQHARTDVVAVLDTELLPPDAAQDRRELEGCNVRALVSRSIVRDHVLFGSLGLARETPGPWPESYVSDVRLLSAAIASRLAEEVSRRSLAEAIERAETAHQSKEHFFAALGHELRTPITAIMGTAELQSQEAGEHIDSDPSGFATSVARDADVVLRAAEQLHAVVEELLGTGDELGGRAETQWVDVAEALADVVHWLGAPARTSNVTVGSDVPTGILVRTTPSALRQILTNLVGNAITYNVAGGSVRVTATRATDEFGRPRARIGVRDTGPGLSPAQQRRVFEPFVRFAGPEVRGTGLGLSLSRSLAERDGGLMGVESAEGAGSVFWLDLASTEHRPV